MGEVNGKTLSISFRVDGGVVEHNNRAFIANNVDGERIGDNIIYEQRDIREAYNSLFGKAVEEYNAKQTRADRKISDYYEHTTNQGRIKPFYEIVVQYGDMESCGLKSGNWEEAKLMLDEYMRGFEERNPNLKVFNAVMHLDEATPHLHIDFIPVAHKGVKGLSVKNSMSGALREQGFSSANKNQNEWTAWEDREKSVMTEILQSHDLSRDVKNVHREHLTVDEYKIYAAQKEEIRKVNAHINELKKKNSVDLTPAEVDLIINQNDVMRSELLKRDEKISSLSRKIGAKFIPFDIFSEEKLQFVVDELTKASVPFVEGSNTVYIPDYAQKTALAIVSNFRPVKSDGIRENIRLTIDKLVYSCENFEDLLGKLTENGYDVKRGKNIAVKSPTAERYVRLKTLGDAYIPKNLEQRIAERDKFPNAIREKFKTANNVEKKFHVTIMDMTVEIRQFRLAPRKDNPKMFYTFQNDANINNLAEQLVTIGDFGFRTQEQIYTKAEELKGIIDEKNANVKSLSDELATLKSDVAQLKHFFSARENSQSRDAMETVKLAAAQEIADKYGVNSEDEIADLEKRVKQLQNKVASIRQDLSDSQLKRKRVLDLIAVYEKIVEGNYIDNLIRGQKDREQSKTIDKRS